MEDFKPFTHAPGAAMQLTCQSYARFLAFKRTAKEKTAPASRRSLKSEEQEPIDEGSKLIERLDSRGATVLGNVPGVASDLSIHRVLTVRSTS